MSEKIQIAASPPATSVRPTDWSLCIICQEQTDVSLVDPAKSRNEAQTSGHQTISQKSDNWLI
jgi:hypothetical protein